MTAEPAQPPVQPGVTLKNWFESKQVWLGIILTILGIATYFADPTHAVTATLTSLSMAVIGIAQVVLRIWFTSEPISPAAARRLQAKQAKMARLHTQT